MGSASDKLGLPSLSDTAGEEEVRRFEALQARLGPLFERIMPERTASRTVVVVPSYSMDQDVLAKVSGVHHYEERMLCLLILLRLPRTHVVFITSQPIDEVIIDYYLHLLPGIPNHHARKRLTMLSCCDGSPRPLSQKILERPRILERIRQAMPDPEDAHLVCFNTTALERTLAVRLGIPLFGADPALANLGSKSSSREIFREAGVDLPAGHENLRDLGDISAALAEMKLADPALKRAVVKLNGGFSGEGNAVFDLPGDYQGRGEADLRRRIEQDLPALLRFEAAHETWESFGAKFAEMKGIVEAWVEGENKRSPSVQFRVDPLGQASVISTHDQVLGGPSGQIYLGASFPASDAYRLDIQSAGERIAEVLKTRGLLGLSAADFVSVPTAEGWKHYAIEVNLRKGGTTFPFLVLQFLTDGIYDHETGLYRLKSGEPRYYYASDNLQKPAYQGLTAEDLIDCMIYNGLHFDATTRTGVVFHLMGALSEFGKFGVTCIGDDPQKAKSIYRRTIAAMDRESAVA